MWIKVVSWLSQTINLYPGMGEGLIVIWSVWLLFVLYFMVIHFQLKMELIEDVKM